MVLPRICAKPHKLRTNFLIIFLGWSEGRFFENEGEIKFFFLSHLLEDSPWQYVSLHDSGEGFLVGEQHGQDWRRHLSHCHQAGWGLSVPTLSKAALVGAKTVKEPLAPRLSAMSAAVNINSKVENLDRDIGIVKTFGYPAVWCFGKDPFKYYIFWMAGAKARSLIKKK